MSTLTRSLILIAPLALAACDVQTSDGNGANVHLSFGTSDSSSDGDNVHMSVGDKGSGDHVAIDVPGFNANLKLPGMNLSTHMDLDGVKLAPDSKVSGMDVFGDDKDGKENGHGQVHIAFSNPGDPAKMLDYYSSALKGADYTIGATTNDSLTATKKDKSFALKVSPDGSGSKGMITITGE